MIPNMTFEYNISMWKTPEQVEVDKAEAARKEAIQLAYKEWKEAQKAKDNAVSQTSQIDDVEEAYRSWIQAKRDKEILMQQM